MGDPLVEGIVGPTVGLAHPIGDTLLLLPDYIECLVRRASIHDQQFSLGVCLGADAFDGFSNGVSSVENCQNYRNKLVPAGFFDAGAGKPAFLIDG